MTDRSTENSAGTGQPPPAGQSSPEPASCRSLLLEISAGCPEEQQQSKSSGYASKFTPGDMKLKCKRAILPTASLDSSDSAVPIPWQMLVGWGLPWTAGLPHPD